LTLVNRFLCVNKVWHYNTEWISISILGWQSFHPNALTLGRNKLHRQHATFYFANIIEMEQDHLRKFLTMYCLKSRVVKEPSNYHNNHVTLHNASENWDMYLRECCCLHSRTSPSLVRRPSPMEVNWWWEFMQILPIHVFWQEFMQILPYQRQKYPTLCERHGEKVRYISGIRMW
jgi:hypothetical protein